jgi:hypothetical protein
VAGVWLEWNFHPALTLDGTEAGRKCAEEQVGRRQSMTMTKRFLIAFCVASVISILPVVHFHLKGVAYANRVLQQHPERISDPEGFREKAVNHFRSGGFIVGIPVFILAFIAMMLITRAKRTEKPPEV